MEVARQYRNTAAYPMMTSRMIQRRSLPSVSAVLILALLCIIIPRAHAQQTDSTVPAESLGTNDASVEVNDEGPQTRLDRLAYVQNVLTQKLADRSALGERIEAANEQDQADLRRQADELTSDIQQLRNTLESIAIGGIDTSLFAVQEPEPESNWREDLALIAQPVIDSLKELTEKPRRLAELNDAIALQQQEADVASEALDNLEPLLQQDPAGQLKTSLERLKKLWEGRLSDAQSAIEIARFQIADLQGDKSFTQTLVQAVRNFITGRGLTLVIAALAATAVYLGVRFLLRGYRASLVDNTEPESRTRYRLAAYSVKALTFILILIAIFVVFYQRGDVLLLGLLILLIVGLALGIRNLLPRYISEARLLLNIGAMREAERIHYRGLPWRVESINMYTVLRNPELHGVLRVPLAEFHDMTSRPSGKDPWFPTSRGDVVIFDDGSLLEVIDQNPDTVELRHRGGEILSIPTTDFYTRGMTNLTRGGTFGLSSTFGIDYDHQDISQTRVPKILRDAVRDALAHSDLNDFVRDVRVELKEAGASSIDYWIFVSCDSRAAKSYYRIGRLIQSSCIEASSRESLGIPFPHVSVVQKPA